MQHDVQVRSLEGILKKLSLQCIVISLTAFIQASVFRILLLYKKHEVGGECVYE